MWSYFQKNCFESLMFKIYFKIREKLNNPCYRYPHPQQLDLTDINTFPSKFSLSWNKFLGKIPICKGLRGNELFEDEWRLRKVHPFFVPLSIHQISNVLLSIKLARSKEALIKKEQTSAISEPTRIKTSTTQTGKMNLHDDIIYSDFLISLHSEWLSEKKKFF